MKVFKINKFNKFIAALEDDNIKNRLNFSSNNSSPSIVYYEKIPLFPVFGKSEMSNFLFEADDKLLDIIKSIEIDHKFDKKGSLVSSNIEELDNLENLADLDLLEQIIEEDIQKLAKQIKNNE